MEERPKRRSPTKRPTPGKQTSEPVEDNKVSRGGGKGGKRAVDVRTSTSDKAVEVKGAKVKKPPRATADDVKVRTSVSDTQVPVGVGLHRKKRHAGKRIKEITRQEDDGPPPRPLPPDDGYKAKRRGKRTERGDGEKRSMSPDKPASRRRGSTETKETQDKPDPTTATHAENGQEQRNADITSMGGFLGFVQNIVSFLSPAPARKRRSGPKVVLKKTSWQSGRPGRLRVSEKNIEMLKREAEVARKRHADKECLEVNHQVAMTMDGKDDDKIEVLHSRVMHKRSLHDVKDDTNPRNKGRKNTTATKKSPSKREDGDRNVTEVEKGHKEQVEEIVSTGKKKRNSNRDEKENFNNSKKRDVSKKADRKTSQRSKNNYSEQAFDETTKEKKRIPDVSSEGAKRGKTRSVERSGHENRGKRPPSTRTDPGQKSNAKHIQSKRSTVASARTVKKTPSPTRDATESARNARGQGHKAKGGDAPEQSLKSNVLPTKGVRETGQSTQRKRHKSNGPSHSKHTVKSTPATVEETVTKTDPNDEPKRQTSQQRDASKQKVKSASPSKKKNTETDTLDRVSRNKSQPRDVSKSKAKSTPSPTKAKREANQNNEEKRSKSKSGEASKYKVQRTTSPANDGKETCSGARKCSKSKAQEASKIRNKSTSAKEMEDKDQNEVKQRSKPKVREASEPKEKSTTSPKKVTKDLDKIDDKNQSKTRVDSKQKETNTKTRPAGHTVSVEVVASFSNRDKEELRKKRSQSSGQPNDKQLTGHITEVPSKLSRQRQKREQTKEIISASTTEDEANKAYERPRKPRWLHSKERAKEDSKSASKSGFIIKIPIQKMDQNKVASGEIKSLKLKKNVNTKTPWGKKMTGACNQIDGSVNADLNVENQENKKGIKENELSPEVNQESPCQETKLSTHILENIRNEAKRLGVTLTPKVDKFLTELKESLMQPHLAPARSKSRQEREDKLSPRCTNTQKRSRSAAPETTSVRNTLENSTGNHPKYAKCHSSACIKKKNTRKGEEIKELRKYPKPNIKGDASLQINKSQIDGNGENQDDASKIPSKHNNPLDGLGEELLNTIMKDHRLLDNLDALCEAIRTGKPYVGKSRSGDNKANREASTIEYANGNENRSGDMKPTPNTTLAADLSGDEPNEKTHSTNIDCEICSIDVVPFEKKFARYLDDSYLERSVGEAQRRKSAEEPNLMTKSHADTQKEDCIPKLKSRKYRCSTKHNVLSSQRKHAGRKLLSTSITDAYKQRHFHGKGLHGIRLYDNTSEDIGDCTLKLLHPNCKPNDAKCKSKISRDKPYEHLKEFRRPPNCTERIFSCIVPGTTETILEHEHHSNDYERGRVEQHAEETDDERSIRPRSQSPVKNIKSQSRDSSSCSASTAVVRPEIYNKADEIFRRIMVQKRLRGTHPNVLFASILDKLLQAESSRILAEEKQHIKRSNSRRERFETDTCTTVSVRSSSHDPAKEDECDSLRGLYYRRTNHREKGPKKFLSKLKRKKKGKFRPKPLQLSQDDVSNLLSDDFETRSKNKRRVRTEDVLLSQVNESKHHSRQKHSRDVDADHRDINLCKYANKENPNYEPEVKDRSVQVYRKTEDYSLFNTQNKTKRATDKAVYKCPNKGNNEHAYFNPEFSSYRIDDDILNYDDHLVLACALCRKGKRNVDSHTVKRDDTLEMVSKQVPRYSKTGREQTININSETSEEEEIELRSNKRGENLKEPKYVSTKDSEKVRLKEASISTGKSVEADSRMDHPTLENPSPLNPDNDRSTTDFSFSVPAKEFEISKQKYVPLSATAYLETGTTRTRPDKFASTNTKTSKYVDDTSRKNDMNNFPSTSKQESPLNLRDGKGTKRKIKTSKDRRKIIQINNEEKTMKQKVMTNIKSMSPQKVAEYLYQNMLLNRENRGTSPRQISPCSQTSNKIIPNAQLKSQKTVPRLTEQELVPKTPLPQQTQINKEQETFKKTARNNVSHQSNFQNDKMFNRNATAKIDTGKHIHTSPLSKISEINKYSKHRSPVKMTGTQPMSKLDTHKLNPITTGKRAQSANPRPTKLLFPERTNKGLPSLNKPSPLKSRANPKRSGESVCVETRQKKSENVIPLTQVATLPKVAKTSKVTNIYTVKIDQKPSDCGLKQDKLNFSATQQGKLKYPRATIIPSLQQRSKSDMTRTDVEKSSVREKINFQFQNEQYRRSYVPHREVSPSKPTNKKAIEVVDMKHMKQKEESNTNHHEFFRPSPDPMSGVERGASIVVPQRVQEAKHFNTSRETEQYQPRRSARQDCTDEATGRKMNGLRYQRTRTSVPKASVQNRGANEISEPVTSRLEQISCTPNQSKRSMPFANQDTIEQGSPVELCKTRSRRQCSVSKRVARVPSKMIKSRSFLDRPAFVSVVRPLREDAVNKRNASTKAPKSKVFASRLKIMPSQTRKVVDARAITAKISDLHEMQCQKPAIEDQSKTNGKDQCAGSKEYCFDGKDSSRFNTHVDNRCSSFNIPSTTSPCNPWKKKAEAKQMWWEKHGDKFEKKLSKTSQEIKWDETSSMTSISPRSERTKHNGTHDHNKRTPSNDRHKTELVESANQYNETADLHQQGYHQHQCIEYVTNENKIHEYGCTEGRGCVKYPADRIKIEDVNQRRQHEMSKSKMMCNGKQRTESFERKYTSPHRKQTLPGKSPVLHCKRDSNSIVKKETNENVGRVTKNSITRYSRSRTWHGSPTNFVKRNIIASSQVKSIAERNRAAAKISVERWKQRVECQPMVDKDTSALRNVSIAKRVEQLEGWLKPNKEDNVTSRSHHHECKKDLDKSGEKMRPQTAKEMISQDSAFSNTGKKKEVPQARNTGAVPKYREDKASFLQQSCSRKRETRSDSEGSLNLPMTTCDLSHGYSPVEIKHNDQVKRKTSSVEHLRHELSNKHASIIDAHRKDSSHRKITSCESSEEKLNHSKKQADRQGSKPKVSDCEDESDRSNGDSQALVRCGSKNKGRGKSRRTYLSEEESESVSGSNCSNADHSDTGNSVNSCDDKSIRNDDSSCCVSVNTSETSQEDSCNGEECTSAESAVTAASEGSCFAVDEQSSISQDYEVFSDAKSNDSTEHSNYSLKYQKREIMQSITSKNEIIKNVRSPIHVGDTNVGDLYGNRIESTIFNETLSSNKKKGENDEVTLITPSSENLLAHAVGSKKLSREQNSIKQFYKTVQIPHGPSPSSMRIQHAPDNYQNVTTHAKTTRGEHTPAIIPFNREHVTRMPTILSENNARAMRRELEVNSVPRPCEPCGQRATKAARLKHEAARRSSPAPPQTTNHITQTLTGKKSAPTQTDSRELARTADRRESRMPQTKDETVYNFKDTSNMNGSHRRDNKLPINDREDSASRSDFKNCTEKGGGALKANERPSEINDLRGNHLIDIEEHFQSKENLSGENYLHCFYDDRPVKSKSLQKISVKHIQVETSKRPIANSLQSDNKSKQKHNEVSNRHKETVVQLRKFFEHSKETIEQLELMLSDTEKKQNKHNCVTTDRQPAERNRKSKQATAERAQLNQTTYGEKPSVNRTKKDQINDSFKPSDKSQGDKNVNVIKAPSVVDDTSYSSSTCSFECCSDKHAGIPSTYVYEKCAAQTNHPTKKKHTENTVPIAKKKNQCSIIEDKIISCDRNYEQDEKDSPDISSNTNEIISIPKPIADDYFNASKLAGDKNDYHTEKQIITTSPSITDVINTVYTNSLCKPIAPSEEVIAASCDKNTQLFKLLTRNLDGNGSGKNYLIINNCLKEIVVTVDENGFKLATKSSDEDAMESLLALNIPLISNTVVPQELEKKSKTQPHTSAETGNVSMGNLHKHKRKETLQSTMGSLNQERSTNKTTEYRQELEGNSSSRIVANSRSVSKSDSPFSQQPSTSKESQDIADCSTVTVSGVDQINSGDQLMSSTFTSMESGDKYIEQVRTDRSLEESNDAMTTRTKSCLDEPWSTMANASSSTSKSAPSQEASASAPSAASNEATTSKSSSLGKSQAAICLSSLYKDSQDTGDMSTASGGGINQRNSGGRSNAYFIDDIETRKSIVKSSITFPERRDDVAKTKRPLPLPLEIKTASTKSTVKPELSTTNEKTIHSPKKVDKKTFLEHSASSKPNELPTSSTAHQRNESSWGEALTLESLSTMSFMDRSTSVMSIRSSNSSVLKENISAEDNAKQTSKSKAATSVESKGATRRSKSRKASVVETKKVGGRNSSSTSSGSVRSKRQLATRQRSERKEKSGSAKRKQKSRSTDRGVGKDEDDAQDILSILYEKDKRVFEHSKRSYTESVSNNEEDDQMTDFEMPLSERSMSDASTKRQTRKKKQKPHSREKERTEEEPRREPRKPQGANKKGAKNEPVTSPEKKSDPRATHKIFTQVGKWIGKKIDKI